MLRIIGRDELLDEKFVTKNREHLKMFFSPFVPIRHRYVKKMSEMVSTVADRVKRLGEQIEKGNVA